MPYRDAGRSDIEFFVEHGWLVVEEAIDVADLDDFKTRCGEILDNRDTMARDRARSEGTAVEDREFRIVQASPPLYCPELNNSPVREWAGRFASTLMGREVRFWYD